MDKIRFIDDLKHYLVVDSNQVIREISDGQMEALYSKHNRSDVIGSRLTDHLDAHLMTDYFEEELKRQNQRVLSGECLTILDAHYYTEGFRVMLSQKYPIYSSHGKVVGVQFKGTEFNDISLDTFEEVIKIPNLIIEKKVYDNINRFFKAKLAKMCAKDKKRFIDIFSGDRFKQLSLTKRESECLKWLAQGKTAVETAMILGISPRTVEKYIASLKTKVESKTFFELGLKCKKFDVV